MSTILIDGKEHYLSSYLQTKLPTLGLDPDTYVPYITGADENDETLDEVIELLRVSSESHSEVVHVWTELKNDIIQRRDEFYEQLNSRKEQELLTIKNLESEVIRRELELVKQAGEDELMKKQNLLDMQERGEKDEELKRSLVSRFAYDESVIYDEEGNEISPPSDDEQEEAFVSNRDFAQQLHMEKMKQLRATHNQSKKEERQKTKQAKMEKIKQKEERRQRAQKGERRS